MLSGPWPLALLPVSGGKDLRVVMNVLSNTACCADYLVPDFGLSSIASATVKGTCSSSRNQVQLRSCPKGLFPDEVVLYGLLINVFLRNCSQLTYCTTLCFPFFFAFLPPCTFIFIYFLSQLSLVPTLASLRLYSSRTGHI